MDLRSLIADLKRRHVFRVAWLYGVVAFVVLQAADLLFPALPVPDWAFSTLVLATLAGFPIALLLAWAYDLTPAGVRRTAPAPTEASADPTLPVADAGPAAVQAPAGRFDPRKLAYVGVGILLALVGFGLSAPWLGLAPDGRPGALSQAERARSIAVLPLTGLAEDAESELFADGLTEDIISALSNVPELHVMSRTTAMTYRNTSKNVREIAREQGVGTVLTGVVRRVDRRVRVTLQLVDARTDENVWAHTFDRELSDVFKLQTEIAQYVAAALLARLSPADSLAAVRRVEAYEIAVKAREYFLRQGPHHVEAAIGIYREALALDPGSAAALAGLADALLARAAVAGPEWVDSAAAAAGAALAGDARVAAAHAAQGRVRLAQGRPEEALAALEQASRLDPSDPWLHLARAEALREVGRLEQAIAAVEVATLAAPGDGRYAAAGAWLALLLGDTARARLQAEAALAAEHPEPLAARTLGLLALAEGDRAGAAAALERLLRTGGNEPRVLLAAGELELRLGLADAARSHLEAGVAALPHAALPARIELALLHRRTGGAGAAEAAALLAECVRELELRIATGDDSPATLHQLARAYAAHGRPQEALRRLEEAVERGLRGRIPLDLDPAFTALGEAPLEGVRARL